MRTPSTCREISRLLLVALLAGCSSGRYDADEAKALEALKTRAEFSKLAAEPVELAEGRVRLCPPKNLPEWLKSGAADPRAPAPEEGKEPAVIDPRRLHPPFFEDFPGFVAAYETVFDAPAGMLPVTLSIGAVPTAGQKEPKLDVRLVEQAKLHEGFEKAKFSWKPREVVDRAGVTRAWRVLTLHGPQPIDLWVGGKPPQYEPVEATCEVWLSADADQPFCTVLVWRVPDAIAEKFVLDEIAPLVARSVEVVR